MSDKSVDQQLVERAKTGEKAAFDLLVRKYQNKVVKLVSRYVHDSSEVLDVAQEAFVKAYRALGSFRGDSAFYTWLYRIAINTAKNHLASHGRQPVSSESELAGADEDDAFEIGSRLRETDTPEGLALTEEIKATVLRAIEELPEDLKTAIILRELEGMSYEEIAQTMDCPVGTVRSRLFRARESIDSELRALVD